MKQSDQASVFFFFFLVATFSLKSPADPSHVVLSSAGDFIFLRVISSQCHQVLDK